MAKKTARGKIKKKGVQIIELRDHPISITAHLMEIERLWRNKAVAERAAFEQILSEYKKEILELKVRLRKAKKAGG